MNTQWLNFAVELDEDDVFTTFKLKIEKMLSYIIIEKSISILSVI